MTAFQYLTADPLWRVSGRADSLAPGVMEPTDEPILPATFYRGLGQPADSQVSRDQATAKAQHDAALAAIAARNSGDMAAYSQAIASLYSLGIVNATAANNTQLQQIADDASVNMFTGLAGLAKWLAIGAALVLVGPTLWRATRRARG